jgi:hypothetical protein
MRALQSGSASHHAVMTGFPKVRTLWILGVMLVCCGALFHSHAESWATSVIAPDYAPTQRIGIVDLSA